MVPPVTSYLSLFRRYLAKDWQRLSLLVALTAAGLVFRLLTPQWLRVYINAAVAGEALQTLVWATVVYTVLNLVRHGSVIAYRMLSEMVGLRATDALRADVVAHCLALDLSYHKEHTPGEMISRLDHDVNNVSDFFAKFWSGILVSILSLLGALVVIVFEAPVLGLVLSFSTGLSLLGIIKLKNFTVPYIASAMPSIADHYATLEEHLAAAEDIRGNGAVAYTFARFSQTLSAWKTTHRDSYMASSALWSAMQLAFSLNTVLTFVFCFIYWRQGIIQVGTAFMLVNYAEQLRQPLNELRMRLQDLQKADAAIRRLNETFAIRPNITDTGQEKPGVTAPELRFDMVSFAYEPGQQVLDQLSFVLPAGKVLGLLGRTGSGKSSLARLLMRFYEPQNGEIYLDARPLKDFPLRELRHSIAFVTQEVQLFRASIRDNLTFFDDSISDEVIHTALESLDLSDWLADLPQGLDSVLGEEFGLSAGESQLLALTRAFLRQPTLVVLDEASARLDPVTERRMNQAISRLLHNRTGIIIAHRLNTLERVDQIMILDQGHILEHGDYRVLKEDPDSQFSLLLHQLEVQL